MVALTIAGFLDAALHSNNLTSIHVNSNFPTRNLSARTNTSSLFSNQSNLFNFILLNYTTDVYVMSL
jgi:hypothetical protein